jgi:pimeloyl-ACP methyl ester carboxylesterase
MSHGGWIVPVVAAGDPEIAFVVSMSGTSVTPSQQLRHEEVHNISHFTWPIVARILAPITTKRILKMDHVRSYADFDPTPYWKKVDVPVFFAFGEGDENVPVEESIKVLKERLRIDLIDVYPGGGHAIRDMQTNKVQDEFLDDLEEFIRHLGDRLGNLNQWQVTSGKKASHSTLRQAPSFAYSYGGQAGPSAFHLT